MIKIQKNKLPDSPSLLRRRWKGWLLIFFLVIGFYLLVFKLRNSAFFQKKDRINLVIHNQQMFFYSLGLSDNINYFISFYPDLEIIVPGGYGRYRLGALAKLAGLEKDPDLLGKTYSFMTSSFLDYFFYPDTGLDQTQVEFGKTRREFYLPRFSEIFFAKSNAGLLDRLYIYSQFLGKTKSKFKLTDKIPINNQGNRAIFLPGDFYKSYQGLFYQESYRKEKQNVQIVYTKSYLTAQIISQILEGEGIRVVDLNQESLTNKKCEVVEDDRDFSQTALAISRFLRCRLSIGETQAYDIILKLGEVEEKWEVE